MGGSVHHGVPGTKLTVSLLKLERKKIGIVTFLDNLTISKVFFVLEPFRKCMSRSVLNNGGLWSQRCSSWVFFGFQSIAQFDLVASLLQCHCGIVSTNVNAPDQKTALRA